MFVSGLDHVLMPRVVALPLYTLWVKKGPLYFCPYLSQILTDFQKFFNIELRSKYTLKQLLHFTTNPDCEATISCEIMNCKNDVIFIDDRRQFLQ
jgi:hypothetical protein